MKNVTFGELSEANITNFLIDNGIDIYMPQNILLESVSICLSGDYRTFDFCKYFQRLVIYNNLANYDVFILLSDETDTDVEKHITELYNFFGENLKICLKWSQVDDKYKLEEDEKHHEYLKFWDNSNTRFNIRAQYRRYLINKFKNEYMKINNIIYTYNIFMRFDIIYYFFDRLLEYDVYMCEDHLIFGKTNILTDIINDIGLNFMELANKAMHLPVELRYSPETLYIDAVVNRQLSYHKNNLDIYTRFTNSSPLKYCKIVFILDYKLYIFPPNLNKLPIDFNSKIYAKLNKDLEKAELMDIELKLHYLIFGQDEGRLYKLSQIDHSLPPDFNWQIYVAMNSDLNDFSELDAKTHWLRHGQYENRNYK